MSSYSLKITLNSCVNEQAYLPLCCPDKGWVLREEAKGSCCNKDNTFLSLLFISGRPFTSLCALLRKCFSKTSLCKLFFPVPDSVHRFFYRIKSNSIRFTLNFKNTFFKCFSLSISFKKKRHVIFNFSYTLFWEFTEHFIDIGYFQGLHTAMINNTLFYVNDKSQNNIFIAQLLRGIL